jgi:hypothetical protein
MVIHEGNFEVLERWLADTTMTVHAIREMDSRRVLFHSTIGGAV